MSRSDSTSAINSCSDRRVVFNIKGNDYRLVVALAYNTGVVFVKFVGTHKAYDEIDAQTVEPEWLE